MNEFDRDNVGGRHIEVIFVGGRQIEPDLPIEIFLMIADQGRSIAQSDALRRARRIMNPRAWSPAAISLCRPKFLRFASFCSIAATRRSPPPYKFNSTSTTSPSVKP